MEISIKQLKKFRKDFADIVRPLEEEYGITIDVMNGTQTRASELAIDFLEDVYYVD